MNDVERTGESGRKQGSRKRILVVEDDEFHLELMGRALASLHDDFEIITATTYRHARKLLDDRKPHLVISDLQLPDGIGLDFLSADRSYDDAPVVVITSQGNEDLAVKAMKAGAMDYVVKSERAFEALPRIVVRTIREWEVRAQRNQALKELQQSEERFRAVFESTTDLIAVKNARHEYTHVNEAMADFFGMDPSRIVGLTDAELFGPQAARTIEAWDDRALAGHTVEEQHERAVDGETYTFLDTRVPLRDSQGNITGLAVLSREITQRLPPKKSTNVSGGTAVSDAMRSTMELVEQIAESDGTVLLLGDSGSGKDYLARWIHDHSSRSAGPFFSIDCATIGESLAESELFGHERGAFTGAVAKKRGLVELAEGGTLLLNEIGELPLQLQAKLLTFLDTMSFVRLGGEKQYRVNIRLLAATHRPLREEVAEGRFMTPLYYRLNVITVKVPSLRERKEDLPALIDYLMAERATKLNILPVPPVSTADVKAALAYDWPGNVRELKNIVERSLILWKGGPFRLLVPAEGVPQLQVESYDSVGLPEDLTMKEAVNHVKKTVTAQALQKAGGNRSEAARLLDVSRDALYRYIRDYNIESE